VVSRGHYQSGATLNFVLSGTRAADVVREFKISGIAPDVISCRMSRLTTFILICLSVVQMRGQSMDCSNNTDTQGKAMRGPDGSIAVLRVHSEDDHGKNSHACEVDYPLVITPKGRQEA
jgi:hypothetical protein